jgi:hypothetical protein
MARQAASIQAAWYSSMNAVSPCTPRMLPVPRHRTGYTTSRANCAAYLTPPRTPATHQATTNGGPQGAPLRSRPANDAKRRSRQPCASERPFCSNAKGGVRTAGARGGLHTTQAPRRHLPTRTPPQTRTKRPRTEDHRPPPAPAARGRKPERHRHKQHRPRNGAGDRRAARDGVAPCAWPQSLP